MRALNNAQPEWAKYAIWYQIFPERFCKKNKADCITAAHLEGTTPFSLNRSHAWNVHSWTSDWYQADENELSNGENLKTNILRRRYCGDINGIISRLDYLKQLGVTALYLTPLQYSPSLHKYDGTNFLHSDPFFGSNPINDIAIIDAEDFDNYENAAWTTADMETLELIEQVHARDMKIIFDGVFNHIGYNSKPFQDVLQHREKSKYAGWFHINFKKSTPKKLEYQKFWGCVTEMPKLNYTSPDVKEYVFATLKRWLCPVVDGKKRQGIDGWRIDHAIGVPIEFWHEARNYVKSLKKDCFFIGELIEEEDIIKPYLNQGIFDAVMNYGFLTESCRFFAAEKDFYTGEVFDQKLRHLLSIYPNDCNYMMQNLLGTHDTERIASYIVNRRLKKFGNMGKFFANSHADDHNYHTRKPFERELNIQKMMILFQFAYVGAPMIYYGDEAGMWGANDPDCRKPMMWRDINFTPERIVSNGIRSTRTNVVKFSDAMFAFYQKIIALRKTHSALSDGSFETLYADSVKRVYVFCRRSNTDRVVFAFNREHYPVEICVQLADCKSVKDYLSGRSFTSNGNGEFQISLAPMEMLALI